MFLSGPIHPGTTRREGRAREAHYIFTGWLHSRMQAGCIAAAAAAAAATLRDARSRYTHIHGTRVADAII